jgi:hypothetical protein
MVHLNPATKSSRRGVIDHALKGERRAGKQGVINHAPTGQENVPGTKSPLIAEMLHVGSLCT